MPPTKRDDARIVALSVRQPYADHIVYGGKRVENRSWMTTYRGPVFIHASSGYVREDEDFLPPLKKGARTRSAFIGMVTLAEIYDDYEDLPKKVRHPDFVTMPEEGDPTVLYWLLTNPVAFKEPIPCKGKLNLWTPPADIAAALAKHLKK